MRIALLLLCVVAACLTTGLPAVADDRADMLTYLGLLRQIEVGRIDRATAGFERLARSADSPAMRNTANILHRQLTGLSADRLAKFHQRKFVDTVVLVPDERSLFEAIQLWQDDAIFPVLIDDAWFAPIFIQSYQPKHVVRWRSEDRSAITPRQIAQWGWRHKKTINNPPGLVLVEPESPQRIAGVALAAAYGQPIVMMEAPTPFDTPITVEQAEKMCSNVLYHMSQYKMVALDHWIGITLAGDYPYQYKVPADQGYFNAFDDLMGHHKGAVRFGACGRLTGDTTMATYQAMAGLFLTPRQTLMFNGYALRGRNFQPYALRTPANLLRKQFDVTLINGSRITPERFAELTRGERRYDMIWLNSSGMAEFFDLKGRAFPEHLPVGHATSVHMIHSFSLKRPRDPNTVGGRMLHGGAYWLYGSMREPYLTAFVTPTAVAARAHQGTPLAFAVRQPPHLQSSRPWKLMVIGNPLWAWRENPVERISGTPPEGAMAVTYDAKAPPIERLRASVVLGRPVEHELLDELLQQAHLLTPDQLARVVYLLHRQNRTESIGRIEPNLLKKHPVAQALAADQIATRFDAQIRAEQYADATRSLPRLVRFDYNQTRLQNRLKRWLDAMAVSGQADGARRMLTALRDNAATPAIAQKALDHVLSQAQSP